MRERYRMSFVSFNLVPSYKSHNASDKYPTTQHFVTEMCTCVHISVTKWCIVGYLSEALWDLCNRFNGKPCYNRPWYNRTWLHHWKLIAMRLLDFHPTYLFKSKWLDLLNKTKIYNKVCVKQLTDTCLQIMVHGWFWWEKWRYIFIQQWSKIISQWYTANISKLLQHHLPKYLKNDKKYMINKNSDKLTEVTWHRFDHKREIES